MTEIQPIENQIFGAAELCIPLYSFFQDEYSSMHISFNFKLEVMHFLVISGQSLSQAIGLVKKLYTNT